MTAPRQTCQRMRSVLHLSHLILSYILLQEGFYIYINGKSGLGIDSKPSARITSSEASSPLSECVFFYYNLKEGGIASLSVKTLGASEQETLIWQLNDVFSTGEWHLAQV